MSNDSAGYIDFTIPPIDDKIVRATVLALTLVIGIVTNAFVIVYTFCHPKSLRNSSIIFLLGLSFANMITMVSLVPVQIVATSAEEWVFGSTASEKEFACAVVSYFTSISIKTPSYSLATISVDRFVFLVKPLVYKRYFKPVPSAVALVVIMLCLVVYQAVFSSLDTAVFNQGLLLCHPKDINGPPILAVINGTVNAAPVIVIAVTTVWTFISTHRFIRNDHQQRVDAIGTQEEAVEIENDLYTRQIKNLFGIFGLLLISQILSILPQVTIIMAGVIASYEQFPSWYYFVSILFNYFGCISNPAIQCYFRKDQSDKIKRYYAKLSKYVIQCFTRGN